MVRVEFVSSESNQYKSLSNIVLGVSHAYASCRDRANVKLEFVTSNSKNTNIKHEKDASAVPSLLV